MNFDVNVLKHVFFYVIDHHIIIIIVLTLSLNVMFHRKEMLSRNVDVKFQVQTVPET